MGNSKKGAVAVTGGASGIGLETARLLGERGYIVFLIDMRREALDAACRDLGLPAARGIACDVTDEAGIEAAVAAITAEHRLAGVVNCAGIAIDRPAVETSVADFRRIVDVNLTGCFIVSRAAARHWLAARQPGAIVNITSVSGLTGNKGRSAYGASKGGQNLLTLVMATELGAAGIRVNAVAPGPIDTPLTRSSIPRTYAGSGSSGCPSAATGRRARLPRPSPSCCPRRRPTSMARSSPSMAASSTRASRPEEAPMRSIRHPGPVSRERVFVVPCTAVPLRLTLAAGISINEAIGHAFAQAGFAGGYVRLAGARVDPMRYVIPAAAPDGAHAAWYSEILAPAGVAVIEDAASSSGAATASRSCTATAFGRSRTGRAAWAISCRSTPA
jgi:Dehydrogenases with different specificities (related to short-chain alcohol dehydrogenases)